VGVGTQINIWDNAWIPTSPNRKIAMRRGNIVYTLVPQLIDQEEGAWDESISACTRNDEWFFALASHKIVYLFS
jgi:hypothetical protein